MGAISPAMALRDDVLKALDQVIDPVSGRTVVQQDMISGLVIRDGHVGFVLEVAKDRADNARHPQIKRRAERRRAQAHVERLFEIFGHPTQKHERDRIRPDAERQGQYGHAGKSGRFA